MCGFVVGICWETYPVSGVAAGDVFSDLDVLPVRASAVVVDHASVGSATIGVDLVKSHADLTALGDLGQLVASLGHDGLCACLQVVVTGANGLAKGVSGVALEAGAVLLEGVAAGSVTGGAGVDTKGHASAAGITRGCDDGTVAGNQIGNGEESEGEGDLDGRHYVALGFSS